jgi:hypothetical protein
LHSWWTPLQTTWEQHCSSEHLLFLHGSLWLSSSRSWSQHRSGKRLLTENCWHAVKDTPFPVHAGRPAIPHLHSQKPHTFAFTKVADTWTVMQCRQLSYVAEFTTDIRHVPGVENIVAGTLSRPPSHTAGLDSCLPSHTTGPDSCLPSHTARPDSCPLSHTAGQNSCLHIHNARPDSRPPSVVVVAPSQERLDYASFGRNQLLCTTTQKATSSTSLQLRHINVQWQKLPCDMSKGANGL